MIRIATADDDEMIVDLGKEMHAQSAYSVVPFDADRVRDVVQRHRTEGSLFLMVGEGCVLAGHLRGFAFSYECEAVDTIWYSRRPCRDAIRLVLAFRQWGMERGAVATRIEVGAGVSDKADETMGRLGFQRLGSNWVA